MYRKYFGLHSKPFSLNPDPDFLYLSEEHRHALEHLQYAFIERMPITIILGQVGTGKTTILRYLLRRLDNKQIRTALIVQSDLPPEEFLWLTATEFELSVNGLQKSKIYKILWDFLVNEYREKRRVILLIDEAQNLPTKTLEEVRMLTNVATEKDPLLQIVLLGQPSLREKLMLPEMEQFLQRVAVSYELLPLQSNETKQYIEHRLEVSGMKRPDLFTENAIHEIYSFSKGVPRLINIVCEGCLVYAFGEGIRKIGRDVVKEVIVSKQKSGLVFGKNRKRNP